MSVSGEFGWKLQRTDVALEVFQLHVNHSDMHLQILNSLESLLAGGAAVTLAQQVLVLAHPVLRQLCPRGGLEGAQVAG